MKEIFKVIGWMLLGGFLSYLMLSSCNDTTDTRMQPADIPSSKIKSEVNNIDTTYKQKFDSAMIIIAEKDKVTVAAKRDLLSLQAKARRDEETIFRLQLSSPGNDYEAGRITNEVFDGYVINNRTRDSICNDAFAAYEEKVKAQVSQIDASKTARDSLSAILNRTIDNSDSLKTFNSYLKSQVRKKKTANVLWKGATAIAVGLLIKQSLK